MNKNYLSLKKKVEKLEKQLKSNKNIVISFIDFNTMNETYILTYSTENGTQFKKEFKSLEELEKKVVDLSPKVIITGEDKLEDW